MNNAEYLFAYGSIKSKELNHWIMEGAYSGEPKPAVIKGGQIKYTYCLDQEPKGIPDQARVVWDSQFGIPVLTLTSRVGDKVYGEVFQLNETGLSKEFFDRLDRFESGYQRVVRDIRFDNGETIKAYVYVDPASLTNINQ